MNNIKFDPSIENPGMPESAAYAELSAVRRLIAKLYNAAYWRPDRPVENEAQLWESLRNAIGQLPGQSPEPIPYVYDGVKVELPTSKIRLLASTVRKSEFSTEQTKAFLSLYGEVLEERINKTIRDFIAEKLA